MEPKKTHIYERIDETKVKIITTTIEEDVIDVSDLIGEKSSLEIRYKALIENNKESEKSFLSQIDEIDKKIEDLKSI